MARVLVALGLALVPAAQSGVDDALATLPEALEDWLATRPALDLDVALAELEPVPTLATLLLREPVPVPEDRVSDVATVPDLDDAARADLGRARTLEAESRSSEAAGHLRAALPPAWEALRLSGRWLPEDDPRVLERRLLFANLLVRSGRYEDGLAELLAVLRTARPAERAALEPRLLRAMHNAIAVGLTDPRAAVVARKGLAVARARHGLDSPEALEWEVELAVDLEEDLAVAAGLIESAIPMLRESGAITVDALGKAVVVEFRRGRPDLAEAHVQEALTHVGPRSGTRVFVLDLFLQCRVQAGDTGGARALMRAMELLGDSPSAADPEGSEAFWTTRASLLQREGRVEEACALLERDLARRVEVYGRESPHLVRTALELGLARSELGRLDEARAVIEPLLDPASPAGDDDRGLVHLMIARLALRRDALDEARAHLDASAELLPVARGNHVLMLCERANLEQRVGDLAAAEAVLTEALRVSLERRALAFQGAVEAAAFEDTFHLGEIAASLAAVELRRGNAAQALETLESGHRRVLLDTLARSRFDALERLRSIDPAAAEHVAELRREEQALRQAWSILQRDPTATDPRIGLDRAWIPQRIAELERRQVTGLRPVLPQGRPATAGEIQDVLAEDERLLVVSWQSEAVLVLVVPPTGIGAITGAIVAEGESAVAELAARLTTTTSPPLAALLPASLLAEALAARRWVVVPEGPLASVPIDALVVEEHGVVRPLLERGLEVVLAPSASVYRECVLRARAQAASPGGARKALLLGDPEFAAPREVAGVLVASVVPGSPAAHAGLRPGDRLLELDGLELRTAADLEEILAELPLDLEPVPMEALVERDGAARPVELPGGPTGLLLAREDGGWTLEQETRALRAFPASLSARGGLPRLPGSRAEVEAIARVCARSGLEPVRLLGAEADLPHLEAARDGARLVHLGTHAMVGTRERPLEAGLALALPAEPVAGDFLSLREMLRTWSGRLPDCELAVLAACETQRGVRVGSHTFTLPWGFFCAGVPRVVATLWKVDDTATALFMARFYEEWLGSPDVPPKPPATALAASKRWLRALPRAEAAAACATLGLDAPATLRGGPEAESGNPLSGAEHPFASPETWGAFVLIGAGG